MAKLFQYNFFYSQNTLRIYHFIIYQSEKYITMTEI